MKRKGIVQAARRIAILLTAVMVLTGIPGQVQAAAKKTVTVSTQKELDKALADANVVKINIKTTAARTLTIGKGDYSDKAIVISAANVKINNYGELKKVYVRDAKKYMEYASGNTIKVTDTELTLGVEKGASVKSLYLSKNGAKDTVVIRGTVDKLTVTRETEIKLTNHGELAALNVQKPSEITMDGRSEKAVVVNTGISATGITLTTSVPVQVNAKADISVTLEKGAEASVLNAKNTNTEIETVNKTEEPVKIVKADGTETTVESGATSKPGNKTDETDKSDTGSTGGGSTGGSGIPSDGTGSGSTGGNTDSGNTGDSGIESVTAAGVTLDQTALTLAVGDTETLKATVTPAEAANKNVIWSSSNALIVTVSPTGLITAVATGSAEITATTEDGGFTATCTVTVKTPAQKLLDDIAEGKEFKLTQNITENVIINTTQPAITIDFGTHKITGDIIINAADTTTITLSDNGADVAGAVITGNLTIDAPNAIVTNHVKVGNTVTIKAVASHSFNLQDSAQKVVFEGQGRLHVNPGLTEAPEVSVATSASVVLAGAVGTVTIAENTSANVTVSGTDTTVEEIKVPNNAGSDTVIKGEDNASVKKVVAEKPVTVAAPTTDLQAKANVTLEAPVQTVSVKTSGIAITVSGSAASVATVTTAEDVTALTIAGEGKVEEVDASAKENVTLTVNGNASVKTVVEKQADSVTITGNSSNNEGIAKVTVKSIVVDTTHAKTVYYVGDKLDLTGVTLTANYSNDTTKDGIAVTENMVTDFDTVTAVTGDSISVIVTYGGQKTNYTITVKEDVEITSIAVTRLPDKTEYVKGEVFNPAGMVLTVTKKSGKKEIVEYKVENEK